MYAIISSSPRISSSSTPLGTGDGVDSDCRPDDGEPFDCKAGAVADWDMIRGAGRATLGLSILVGLEGDRPESLDEAEAGGMGADDETEAASDMVVEREVVEFVDAFRNPDA